MQIIYLFTKKFTIWITHVNVSRVYFNMAFSNSALLKTPTMLEQLLEEINFQRTKEMRQLLKDGKILFLTLII